MNAHKLVAIILSVLLFAGFVYAQLPASQIVKRYSPSVVTIVALDQNDHPLSLGSGFFINTEGDIASNHHLLEGSAKAIIKTMDGRKGEVLEIINDDPELDLLIAKTSFKNTNPVPLGDSDTITVGEEIMAIGNPAGLEGTVSNGIVSGVRRAEGFRFIQITAPISPGSSGGPVFNSTGKVIGIATAYLDIGQNLNFAMPINYLKSLKKSSLKLGSLPKMVPKPRTAEKGTVEKGTVEKNTLRVAGIEMKIGMSQSEIMNKLGGNYVLKKIGDDHWGIFSLPGEPLKLYGEIEFRNDKLIRVTKKRGDFYEPDSLKLAQTLFSVLENYRGNQAFIDTKTGTGDPDFRGKAFHLVFLTGSGCRAVTILIWEGKVIRPSVIIEEVLY